VLRDFRDEVETMTAPGWYTDPGYPLLERYWTGTEWTSYTRQAPTAYEQQMLRIAAAQRADQRRVARHLDSFRTAILVVAFVAVVIIVVLSLSHATGG
jgi:hypothetical protein